MKPSIRVIASYYRAGTLGELHRKGPISTAEYNRHIEGVKAYESRSGK